MAQKINYTQLSAPVEIGTFFAPASTGDYSVTDVGFTPKVVRFSTMPVNATNRTGLNMGAMSESKQYVLATAGSTTTISRNRDTTACLGYTNVDGTWYVKASYVSMDADGFTINFSSSNTEVLVTWEAWG